MKILTIKMSDEAYQIMEEYTKIKETTPELYINEYLKRFENWTTDKDLKEKEFGWVINNAKKKKSEEIYKKYKYYSYILKKYKNGRRVLLRWMACPIQDDPNIHENILKENVGKYYFTVKLEEINNRIKNFPIIHGIESKKHIFNSLKSLKKNINKQFVKYGFGEYYKIRNKNK